MHPNSTTNQLPSAKLTMMLVGGYNGHVKKAGGELNEGPSKSGATIRIISLELPAEIVVGWGSRRQWGPRSKLRGFGTSRGTRGLLSRGITSHAVERD